MAFKTQYNSPHSRGEVFTEPSLTDQLANEPLADIVRRFTERDIVNGYRSLKSDVVFDESTTEREVEAAFDDFAAADLPLMSKVEQAEALVDAQNEIERLQKATASKPATKPVNQPPLPEEKPPQRSKDVVDEIEN